MRSRRGVLSSEGVAPSAQALVISDYPPVVIQVRLPVDHVPSRSRHLTRISVTPFTSVREPGIPVALASTKVARTAATAVSGDVAPDVVVGGPASGTRDTTQESGTGIGSVDCNPEGSPGILRQLCHS